MYGCLFSCLLTHAVHPKVALVLDTDSLIMALMSFVGR